MLLRGWCLLAVLLVGCGDFFPDVGPVQNAPCLNEDSDPDNSMSFAQDIAPILELQCLGCHDPGADNPIGVTAGGLILSSYDDLRAGGARSSAGIVVVGAPCDSVLYQKVLSGPPFGGRMPLNGPPYLTVLELQRIHDWIAEGALDN